MKKLIVLLLALAACGGSSAPTAPVTPPVATTLVGTYVLTGVEIFGITGPSPLPTICSADTGFIGADGLWAYNSDPTINYIVGGTLVFDATTATLTVSDVHHHLPWVYSATPPDILTDTTRAASYTRAGDQLTLGDPRLFSATFIYPPADSAIRLSKVLCGSPVGAHYLAQWTSLDFRRQ